MSGMGAVPAPHGTLDEGVAWHFGSPLIEQRNVAAGRAIVRSATVIVRLSGPDRLTWLNTISSQLLTDLAPGDSSESLILSPQGHLEHALRIVADADALWILTEPFTAVGEPVVDAVHPLVAWLERMKFRADISIENVTGEFATLAGFPSAVTAVLAAADLSDAPTWVDPWPGITRGGAAYSADATHPALARPWAVAIVPRAVADALTLPDGFSWAGTWAETALRIEAWRPRLGIDTDARTLPHELDWTRTAVHFDKGCYRGQETVAKVFNLGQPPRRVTMLHLDGSGHTVPTAGAAVHLPDASDPRAPGKNVGRLLSVALHHELGPIALAMVKRSTPLDATLLVEPPALEDPAEPEASGTADVGTTGASADSNQPVEPYIAAAQEPIVRERERGSRPAVGRLQRP